MIPRSSVTRGRIQELFYGNRQKPVYEPKPSGRNRGKPYCVVEYDEDGMTKFRNPTPEELK